MLFRFLNLGNEFNEVTEEYLSDGSSMIEGWDISIDYSIIDFYSAFSCFFESLACYNGSYFNCDFFFKNDFYGCGVKSLTDLSSEIFSEGKYYCNYLFGLINLDWDLLSTILIEVLVFNLFFSSDTSHHALASAIETLSLLPNDGL